MFCNGTMCDCPYCSSVRRYLDVIHNMPEEDRDFMFEMLMNHIKESHSADYYRKKSLFVSDRLNKLINEKT